MAATRTFLAAGSFVLLMVLMSTAAMAADGPAPPPTTGGGGENFSVREIPSVALALFVSLATVFSLAY
ncbi:hypothetical protein MUK42_28699 [Musa troglodytarum]|uniref:Uncharacterized protein n=1 Tax=Musa troglodytarum TaxID=320322 RepID=A0A9E7GDM7_9LILI|nr:hypothetical protein MUK42_28699 [Musa troglodytarum]